MVRIKRFNESIMDGDFLLKALDDDEYQRWLDIHDSLYIDYIELEIKYLIWSS